MTVATYYVDADSGNDANDGSEGSPWLTIAHAAANLGSAPITIVRCTGSFVIAAKITVTTTRAYWVAEGSCTFSCQQGASVGLTNNIQRFYGIDFINDNGTTDHIVHYDQDLVFVDCTFETGTSTGGISVPYRSTFNRCSFDTIPIINAQTGMVLLNNTFHNSQVTMSSGVVEGNKFFGDVATWLPLLTFTGNDSETIHNSFVSLRTGLVYEGVIKCENARTMIEHNVLYAPNASVFRQNAVAFVDGLYFLARDMGLNSGDLAFNTPAVVLANTPYADPANGDWTPSAELSAIVGSDGLTPGAVQASSGGDTLAQLQRGIRLGNRGIRA